MKRVHNVVRAVAFAVTTVGIMAACDRVETPVQVSATNAPAIAVDDVNHTIALTDPAYPQKPLIIRVDTSTRTQYMDCGDFHVINGTNWLAEYTNQDYLEMSFEDFGNGRHLERYYFNGQVLELEINDLTGPSPEQIRQFLDFLPTDPAVNSLANHPDGLLMASLLTRGEPSLVGIIQARTTDGQDYVGGHMKDGLPEMQLLRPDWANVACGAAWACQAIACKVLPWTNPVCWGCTAAVVVCIIMDVFGWW